MRELLERFWGKGSGDVGFEVKLRTFCKLEEEGSITITPTLSSVYAGRKVTLKWSDSENPIEDILLYFLKGKPLPGGVKKGKIFTDESGKKYRVVEVIEEED